jgi:hypothetical protein
MLLIYAKAKPAVNHGILVNFDAQDAKHFDSIKP